MHEFRATQAEQKIVREKIKTEELAILAHGNVAAEVRRAVQNMGGEMPENLPAEPNIKKLVSPKRTLELRELNRPHGTGD
jgi:DNA-damage-inducible protein D